MTIAMQKRLAIAGAVIGIAVFLAANLHLVVTAYRSQPACTLVDTSDVPARRDC